METLVVTSLACAAAAVLCCVGLVGFAFRSRAAALKLQSKMTALGAALDTLAQRATDQARRIAWLESRLQRSAAPEAEPTVDGTLSEKTLITERRHRVLTLFRRGLDVQQIAATLSVPHGEVELIIGMNNAA